MNKYEDFIRRIYQCEKEQAPGACFEVFYFLELSEKEGKKTSMQAFTHGKRLGEVCTYLECAIFYGVTMYGNQLSEEQKREIKENTPVGCESAKELKVVIDVADRIFRSIGL